SASVLPLHVRAPLGGEGDGGGDRIVFGVWALCEALQCRVENPLIVIVVLKVVVLPHREVLAVAPDGFLVMIRLALTAKVERLDMNRGVERIALPVSTESQPRESHDPSSC